MTTVLVVNAGSATLKVALLAPDDRDPLATDERPWRGTSQADRAAAVDEALGRVLSGASLPAVVGHRLVHGGPLGVAPLRLDAASLDALSAVVELAPNHLPVALDTIRAAQAVLPAIPHVATFDTAFHAGLPEEERIYPVPWRWQAEHGIRRYGFHGLSVRWAIRRAAELTGDDPDAARLVVAHLGGGCSVTAVDARRSVATSMGMTPLEGLMMGTRSGSIDPAIVFRLLRRGVPADRIEAELTEQSGLVGITGRSGMREVVAAAADGDRRSGLAVAMFVSRAAAAIAAAATRLPALDWLIFTGAIGERAGGVRARIVERLAVLGVPAVAPEATGDTVLTPRATGRPGVLVIAAREDLVIAEDARAAARPRRDRTEDPPGQAE